MDDLISRRQAIDALNVGAELLRRILDDVDIVGVERAKYEWGLGLIESCISDMKELPSAQSSLDEWCPDCKEYDSKRHCCPRLNRVIRTILKDGRTERKAGRWIPFTTRPLTEEEKEEHPEWDSILDCKLPDDGQQILISVSVHGHERVQYDEFYTDDGSYLDSGYEIGTEAVAWMPLPEPYGGESE